MFGAPPQLENHEQGEWAVDQRAIRLGREDADFGSVSSLAWSSDSRHFLIGTSGNSHQEIHIAKMFNVEHNFDGLGGAHVGQHRSGIAYAEFSPDSRYILSLGRLGTLVVWDKVERVEGGYSNNSHALISGVIAWDDSSTRLASADHLGDVMIWTGAFLEPQSTFRGHYGRVTDIQWQPQGDLFATRVGIKRSYDSRTFALGDKKGRDTRIT
jgi:WD40 repeat protein